MRWLLLLFVVVPLVELYLLLAMGSVLGFWPTVGIVLVTGGMGAFLAKREGLKVLRSYQEALAQGRLPDEGVVGGLLVFVGGALLITPGVLTDAVGMALLIPFTRRRVADWIRAIVAKRIDKGVVQVVSMGDGFPPEEPEVLRPNPFIASPPWKSGEVVDTEGVEVQSAKLLGEPGKPDNGAPSG